MLNPQACFDLFPFFACLFCSFFALVIMQKLNAANPGNSSPSPATAPSRRPAGWKISQLSRCLVKLCKRPLHCAKRITYSLVIAMSVYCTHTHRERRRERERGRERGSAIIVGHAASTCWQLVGNCVNASSVAASEMRPQCRMYVYA